MNGVFFFFGFWKILAIVDRRKLSKRQLFCYWKRVWNVKKHTCIESKKAKKMEQKWIVKYDIDT